LGLALVAVILALFTQLRPIADDYCFSAKAGPGVLPGIRFWFDEWMGDITSNTLNTIVVGLPIIHLPWPLASWISRVAVAVAIFLLAMMLLRYALAPGRRAVGWGTTLLVGTVALLAWWTYWWTRTTLLPISFEADITEDSPAPTLLKALYEISALWVTHSSNINAQYIFAICIGLLLVVVALSSFHAHPTRSIVILVASGIFIGFSGPVMAVSYIVGATIVIGWLTIRRRTTSVTALAYISFVLPLLAAAYISNQSPGTRQRQAMMLSNPDYSSITLSEGLADPLFILQWTFPRAFIEWGSALANIGTVSVLALTIPAGFLVHRAYATVNTTRLMTIGLQLIGFSLVISIVNRASEVFSYVGIWHQIYATTVLFFGIVLVGLATGQALAGSVHPKRAQVAIAASSLIGIALLAIGLSSMLTSVSERSVAWEAGPAPLPRIPDIESLTGCWAELGEYRQLPSR